MIGIFPVKISKNKHETKRQNKNNLLPIWFF